MSDITNYKEFSGIEFAKYCIVIRKLMCNVLEFWKYFPNEKNVELGSYEDDSIKTVREIYLDPVGSCSPIRSNAGSKSTVSFVYLFHDESIYTLTFLPISSKYMVYDSDYFNRSTLDILEPQTEEYWFQQSLVQKDYELFCSQFFSTLQLYDSLQMLVHGRFMYRFINRNREQLDKLVQEYPWSSYEVPTIDSTAAPNLG